MSHFQSVARSTPWWALSVSGLVVQRVRAEANVLTPTSSYPVGAIIRSVLPRLLHLGITTEAEVDVDTLDHRLAAERLSEPIRGGDR